MGRDQLSSLDIRILVRELKNELCGLRVDKVYQVGKRELVLRLYGRGSKEFIVAPRYMCLTRYRRKAPKTPSGFAMQLRKNLKGKAIEDVLQHGFDRIVEIHFEDHILVCELFSKGNIILCDLDYSIKGILEWQKWRDRVLGVKKRYMYPPQGVDIFKAKDAKIIEILRNSGRGCASSLATLLGLGPVYAELVCDIAGIHPKKACGEDEANAIVEALGRLKDMSSGEVAPCVGEEDFSPFGKCVGQSVESFNDAVDEYFSKREIQMHALDQSERKDQRREKLENQLEKQVQARKKAEKDIEYHTKAGDRIYERYVDLEDLLKSIVLLRKRNLSDDEILETLGPRGLKGLNGFEALLEA